MHLSKNECRAARAVTGIIGAIVLCILDIVIGNWAGVGRFIDNIYQINAFKNHAVLDNPALLIVIFLVAYGYLVYLIYTGFRVIFCPLKYQ